MYRKILQKICIVGMSGILLSSCASIISSTSETVSINSNVKNPIVKITNNKNIPIYYGSAPTSLSLKKKEGFFNGETYTITAEKAGYIPTTHILDTSLNWWYWGNIIFGGLIGMLIVDPATGAMWDFEDENIFLNMMPVNY